MSKRIYLISAIVFTLGGLFFLVVPFSTHEIWGTVVAGRVGNLITGLVLILVAGILGYLSFRKGVARDLSSSRVKTKLESVPEEVITGRALPEQQTPPPATAPTPTPEAPAAPAVEQPVAEVAQPETPEEPPQTPQQPPL